MSEEEKKKKGGVSRREFLRDAGFAVGGVAVSSTVLGVACAPKEVVKEVPGPTKEVIKEVPGKEVIKEVPGPTRTVEVTKEVPAKLTKLIVNGQEYKLGIAPNSILADVLRYQLGMTGTKIGCSMGGCGMCTVLLDGKPILSCSTLADELDGRKITTIEGLATGDKLHRIQQAWLDYGCIECGYCTPGIILATKALLDENPHPTEVEIKNALVSNICNCQGTFYRILEAVKFLAK